MPSTLHVDLLSLRVFLAVAKQGGLTRAADGLNMTVSAVSKRLAELERSVGCVLLARQPRGVTLTAAGEAMLLHARQVVERMTRMADDMHDYANGVQGNVRVWANTSAIIQFLPQDLRAFSDASPKIRVQVAERVSDDIVAAIVNGEADVGVFADNVASNGIEKMPYREDRLVLLVPQGHPLAGYTALPFEAALDFEFVGLTQGSSLLSRMTDAALALDRPLRLRIQVSSFDAICRMIGQGLGIGVLPEGAVSSDSHAAGLSVVTLTDAWAHRALWVGVLTRAGLRPEALRFFDFLTRR